jgi:hypothetical protein
MIKILIKVLLSLGLALTLGLGSAWLSTGSFYKFFQSNQIKNGVWETNLNIGSQSANPYLRAYVARFGLLALNSSETIYFFAQTDSEGNPLNPQCTYQIKGQDFATRWWSITAYCDSYLIPNAENQYSISKTTVKFKPQNEFEIFFSPEKQGENWLPSGNKIGKMSLVLRFYNPNPAWQKNPAQVNLPQIIKIKCNEKQL